MMLASHYSQFCIYLVAFDVMVCPWGALFALCTFVFFCISEAEINILTIFEYIVEARISHMDTTASQ